MLKLFSSHVLPYGGDDFRHVGKADLTVRTSSGHSTGTRRKVFKELLALVVKEVVVGSARTLGTFPWSKARNRGLVFVHLGLIGLRDLASNHGLKFDYEENRRFRSSHVSSSIKFSVVRWMRVATYKKSSVLLEDIGRFCKGPDSSSTAISMVWVPATICSGCGLPFVLRVGK